MTTSRASKASKHSTYLQQRRDPDGGKIKNEVDRYMDEPPEDIDLANSDKSKILLSSLLAICPYHREESPCGGRPYGIRERVDVISKIN